MKRSRLATTGALLISLLGASLASAAPSIPAYIAAAVVTGARRDEENQRDAARKPAETLAFAGVKPGDTVIEITPGKGYYTRLLSAVVGPRGKVYAVTSPPKPDKP